MLTVSLVGKKFSCSIQLQISTEKEGGGLELALKAGEKCTNRPQSISNVNASLNVTIQSGCSNYVTKCKEMLMFLQEQALPKTMNIMKVHMVNKQMKNIHKDQPTRLFSCIKQKKRERAERSVSADRLTSRGYSSDSEQVYRSGHMCSADTVDILATPRMSRHRLKNAALLRDRRIREASKERTQTTEKGVKKESKNITIELHLKESTKSKKTATRKLDTEYENEGALKYEGGSESSLYEATSTSTLTTAKDFEDTGASDTKDCRAAESDMSMDSLESCLDLDDAAKTDHKKKKKKKGSTGEESVQQADRKSHPSLASIVPPLVLPEDSDDASTGLSDYQGNYKSEKFTPKKQDDQFIDTVSKSESLSSQSNLTNLLRDELYQILKQSAHQIVQEVICSALKKCLKGSASKPTTSMTGFEADSYRSKIEEPRKSTPRSTQTSPIQLSFNNRSSAEGNSTVKGDASKQHSEQGAQSTSNYAVKLYDTHDNITKRIISSVSRALHFKPKYVTPSRSHALVSPDLFIPVTQQYVLDKAMPHSHAFLTNPYELQSASTIEYYGKELQRNWDHQELGNEGVVKSHDPDHVSLIEEFCKRLPYSSKAISHKINNTGDEIPTSGYCFFVIGPEDNTEPPTASRVGLELIPGAGKAKDESALTTGLEFEVVQRRRLERPKSTLYRRSISDQNERRKWQTSSDTADSISSVQHRAHSLESRSTRANKCVSCPVLSEEDLALEGLESHHQDVCNSLSQRTWIVIRVHELWKANKPLEALTTCMELTGMTRVDACHGSLSGSSTALDMVGNKDIVLFLNILQQLPSSCSAWSLSTCELLLPELKLFISTRIHTSHVDMACTVLLVIVKKVSGAVLKAQTANKEKSHSDVLKKCVSHLQHVKEKANQVLMARRGKVTYSTLSTEDPIALKPVLRELLAAIQTLMNVYTE